MIGPIMPFKPENVLNLAHLPRSARELVRVLRVIAYYEGESFSERTYERVAEAIDLPRIGLVRRAFGGSFVWALVAAGVGDPAAGIIPRTPYQLKGWHLTASDEDLVAGIALGVRLQGHWVRSDAWNREVAKPARDRGYPVPYVSQIQRRFGDWTTGVELAHELLCAQLGGRAPHRLLPPNSRSDETTHEMADARDILGAWPNSEEWDDSTRPLRESGREVPTSRTVFRHFESWPAATALRTRYARRGVVSD